VSRSDARGVAGPMQMRSVLMLSCVLSTLVACASRSSLALAPRTAPVVHRPAPTPVVSMPIDPGRAQRELNGRITDRRSHQPVSGVTVVITGHSEGLGSQATISDDDGRYAINDLLPGYYLVTFFFGEIEVTRNVQVGDRTITMDQLIDVAAAVPKTIVID
jgi:Carboxypeptidase regulatory-like domain